MYSPTNMAACFGLDEEPETGDALEDWGPWLSSSGHGSYMGSSTRPERKSCLDVSDVSIFTNESHTKLLRRASSRS